MLASMYHIRDAASPGSARGSPMMINQLVARAQGRLRRSAARYLYRCPLLLELPVPLISFTFDDFPRSALHAGGAILEDHGIRGTYFASFGLMGTTAPTGPIFEPADLGLLLERGHELGCHSFAHGDSWETGPAEFAQSVEANERALGEMLPGATFRTFSYPISPPRPATKRAMSHRFDCCRGGGQTFNSGIADLGYLAAFFIEQSRDAPDDLKEVIDRNAEGRGWLILATHDISPTPTPYGCTPSSFEGVVRYAIASGARILPVVQALELARATAPDASFRRNVR